MDEGHGAYKPVPTEATESAGTPAATEKVLALLRDLAQRKEFGSLKSTKTDPKAAEAVPGFVEPTDAVLGLPGMRLHGAQLFDQNLFSPDTPYQRLLVDWQTGTGKTIDVISIALRFIRSFRQHYKSPPEERPSVFVIGFTRSIFIQDMLKYPELGFISYLELEELQRVRAVADRAGPASQEARHLAGLLGTYRRRITDRARGGYFHFPGYKEFANAMFVVTRQGAKRGFDVQTLYERTTRVGEEGKDFGEQLAARVRAGDVVVDTALLQSMRGGLLIADEIHNVYNIRAKNNYGIAIQYALDALGDEAPRSVLISATAVTGSAMEVVDLLNLLVPRDQLPGGAPLRRADFFAPGGRAATAIAAEATLEDDEIEEEGPVSQLLPGALERISHLAAGRVSFLLDTDVASYPVRRFEGEAIAGIPYLKFTQCPMSPLHEKTLDKVLAEMAQNRVAPFRGFLPPNAYSLYDMVFPNPPSQESPAEFALRANSSSVLRTPASETKAAAAGIGLYQSGEVAARLRAASPEWKEEMGVTVMSGPEAGLSSGINVITGDFLMLPGVKEYSGKFAALMNMILERIRSGPGKIMVYHPRVRTSGVLLIQELLRMNGFADELSQPTGRTICAVCAIPLDRHAEAGEDQKGSPAGEAHAYTPARFIMAHSEVDRAVMERSIAKYNSPENADGYRFRVAVGARIVTESRNFRAVRLQIVVSLPTDIPTLIQVFGRVVRKGSHTELPRADRKVEIHTLVSVWATKDARSSPEVMRCMSKMEEYLVIQQVMGALRKYAVDGFANYGRMIAADPSLATRATIDSLPFAPAIELSASRAPPTVATFEAYGHGVRESNLLQSIIRVLFAARPVWTYSDLWEAARSGAVEGVGYDPKSFSEGNFAVALRAVTKRSDGRGLVVFADPFYVLCPLGADGRAIVGPESYIRTPAMTGARVTVRLSDYLRKTQQDKQFESRLKEFNARYLSGREIALPGGPPVPLLEMALVEMEGDFHFALLRRLVEESLRLGNGLTKITLDDTAVIALYRRFKILLTAKDVLRARDFKESTSALQKLDQSTPVAFVGRRAVTVFVPGSKEGVASHKEVPLATFKIGRRQKENDIVVGFVSEGSAHTRQAKFKIRPPTQKLQKREVADARSIERGAVCETRSRNELARYVAKLRAEIGKFAGADGGAADGKKSAPALAASSIVRQRFPPISARTGSTTEMCMIMKLLLLSLEEMERSRPNGMEEGLRWLYLFHDSLPTLL